MRYVHQLLLGVKVAYRFICYGKSLENIEKTLAVKLVGSSSAQFINKVQPSDKLFLYSRQHVWAIAHAKGKGFVGRDSIWPDDLYPYRMAIADIRVFKSPFSFQETAFREQLLKSLGRAWPYKVLFTPNELPNDVGAPLWKLLEKQAALDERAIPDLIRANVGLGLNNRQLRSLKARTTQKSE